VIQQSSSIKRFCFYAQSLFRRTRPIVDGGFLITIHSMTDVASESEYLQNKPLCQPFTPSPSTLMFAE
jgi:hypothetical protein